MHFHPTPEGSGYSRAKYRKARQGVEHSVSRSQY